MAITLDGTNGITTPQINAGNIVGQVCFFGMTTAPEGFLKANGAAISRTTFAELFAAIGTTYGAGDGSTTFNLPDLRGEFPRGFDDGRGVDSGRSFGSAQLDQLQDHMHASGVSVRSGLKSNQLQYARAGYISSPVYSNTTVAAQGSTNSDRVAGVTSSVLKDNTNWESSLSENERTIRAGDFPDTVNSGDETRPRNRALLACIKF